jgi:hypothetical protein
VTGQFPLPPIERPNGKIYRPRKIRAIYCENPYGRRNDVFVLGTHDLIGALEAAAGEVRYRLGGPYFLIDAVGELGWWREMLHSGERVVVSDDVRGAAGIRYEVEER